MTRKIWNSRPPASSRGGRVAWDLLTAERPDVQITELWYAHEMDDGAWCARYEDGHASDVDVLVTSHRVNRARSLKAYFRAGQCAARNNEVEEARRLWITSKTPPENVAEFEQGVSDELASQVKGRHRMLGPEASAL